MSANVNWLSIYTDLNCLSNMYLCD